MAKVDEKKTAETARPKTMSTTSAEAATRLTAR